ncbi:DUF1376 domain-containing protein [Azospirillum rugosum]|uniref:Uncharacterized protein YdaU (DUF1376 family) n=1 Tax=Azospirillum rugosum TaxID=416170 RepID=A0ABS4SEN2_9PROT|nr:DUF1376 domain-containing protein [Azospirillum rugosum]MBP2291026.1 uncharacterized protein YdaU (DUF1376 family) [Azospirillum rugosum]MDQ0524910.1 uncharacterized protein YdaU (DUF1376 family) [Azospirillum rugosum]
MGKLRHVDYYPDEFIVGTSDMPCEVKGAYWTICSLIYSKGGPVQDDAHWLAKVCGLSTRRWPSVRKALLDSGKITVTDGKLSNNRCMVEIERAEKRSKQATVNGEQGGRPRGSAPAEPRQTHAEPQLERQFSGANTSSSDGVDGRFASGDLFESNGLGKPGGFSGEKLTNQLTNLPTNHPPYAPPAGGSSPAGEPTDQGLPEGDAPRRSRRARGDRGTRVPDGPLPEAWATAANHTREKHHYPLLSRRLLAVRWEAFQNYWRGVSGSKGFKLDWKATWLNDCIDNRTEKRFPPEAAAKPRAPMIDTTG